MGESQKFWLSLLRDVLGVEHPEQFIDFENRVLLEHSSFIDGCIPSTKVMIEQKALGRRSDTVAGSAIMIIYGCVPALSADSLL